jgi:uncharacterized membrane protein
VATTSATAPAKRAWLVPTGLIMLALLPVLGGTARVANLAGGEITEEDAHFFASPVPVVVHVCTASVYLVLGAFQFSPGFRARRPGWHRSAGRLLIPCGMATASSGLWMTLFYPRPAGFGERLLAGFQLSVGSAWILFLVLGFAAIRRRDVTRHRAWMIRAYALGSGTGTQVLTLGIPTLVFGEPSQLGTALEMLAGWLINIAVAERIIRRLFGTQTMALRVPNNRRAPTSRPEGDRR